MMPTIAVLIPTKNRKNLLERALKSVFNQTVSPEEIMVVNDGSTDETKEFLESLKSNYSNLKVINREEGGGVNTARNRGLKEAQSEWVAFLDDDDEFAADAIKVMKEKIYTLPQNFSVAYFNSRIIRDGGSFIGGFQFDKLKERLEFYDPSYKETMTKFNLKGDCKQVMRRELFSQEKYKERYKFPETVNGFESYTMNLIARDRKGIRYFPESLTVIHQESILQDRLSITAPKKNPTSLFVLHFKQIFQHFQFYLLHPILLLKKKWTMVKLLIKVVM